jgi:hypothetical protein
MGSVHQPSSPDATYDMSAYNDIAAAQQNFAQQYSYEHPNQAMSEYAKYIHQHTKQQLEKATSSARRRSNNDGTTPAVAALSTESSTDSGASSINEQSS